MHGRLVDTSREWLMLLDLCVISDLDGRPAAGLPDDLSVGPADQRLHDRRRMPCLHQPSQVLLQPLRGAVQRTV